MPTRHSHAATGFEGCSGGNVLQDHFACGVMTIDAADRAVAITPGTERLLRLPNGSKFPLPATSLPAPIHSVIAQVRRTGAGVADREFVFESIGAAPVALSVSVMPVQPGDAAGSLVVLLRDISSAGTLEHDMRRLNRLASIGTLAASAAHEIKNALVPVRTFVGMLLERNPQAELAGTVGREMERVDTIVSRMLKFSAPVKPTLAIIGLHELLDHSLRLVQHRVEGKLIALHRQFEASPDALSGDDHQLEQAFLNLLINAVEAMGAEGALTVRTDVFTEEARLALREGPGPTRFLRVSISDTGPGIPPENLGTIFDPFFTTKKSGTGLGLAVTRNIIEEHKGLIRVESAPGKGSTFMVLLPCSVPAAG
jgi:two-component system, NtrC family, nitrogen regulation sensor histidine kinase GlnL